MFTDNKKPTDGLTDNQPTEAEKKWENPVAPEETADERDAEQFKRQQKEAERRKENLTGEEN